MDRIGSEKETDNQLDEVIRSFQTCFRWYPVYFIEMILVAVVMCYLGCRIIRKLDLKAAKWYAFSLSALLALMYFITVLGRHPGYARNYELLWMVLREHRLLQTITCAEKVWNIFLFVPLGMMFGRYGLGRTCMMGFLFSAFIEVSQFILCKGTMETMDLLTNTFGTIFGYGVYALFRRICIRRIYKRK